MRRFGDASSPCLLPRGLRYSHTSLLIRFPPLAAHKLSSTTTGINLTQAMSVLPSRDNIWWLSTDLVSFDMVASSFIGEMSLNGPNLPSLDDRLYRSLNITGNLPGIGTAGPLLVLFELCKFFFFTYVIQAHTLI